MRALSEAFAAHLASGATSLCRCWRIVRRDGVVLGFTDHDRDLAFDDTVFRARSGLDAAAIESATGLAVDNSQAVGALSDAALSEDDIRAGLYDGTEVLAWLVNWRDPAMRLTLFRGSIGEIRRTGTAFEAELRGLSEWLNQPVGRAYHRNCSAVLGDKKCGFDVLQAGYFAEAAIAATTDPAEFDFTGLAAFEERWFEKGVLRVLDGAAAGKTGIVRSDRLHGAGRRVALWQALGVAPAAGDRVRLEAGCDKRAETCRLKFHNFTAFRGFPDIPGDDWTMAVPTGDGIKDGGSRR